MPGAMSSNAAALSALERLLKIAASDTGQSRRVANFLLAWWNSASCGGFDLTDIWAVDEAIGSDIAAVLSYVSRNPGLYPDSLGFGPEFEALVREWRPHLVVETSAQTSGS